MIGRPEVVLAVWEASLFAHSHHLDHTLHAGPVTALALSGFKSPGSFCCAPWNRTACWQSLPESVLRKPLSHQCKRVNPFQSIVVSLRSILSCDDSEPWCHILRVYVHLDSLSSPSGMLCAPGNLSLALGLRMHDAIHVYGRPLSPI